MFEVTQRECALKGALIGAIDGFKKGGAGNALFGALVGGVVGVMSCKEKDKSTVILDGEHSNFNLEKMKELVSPLRENKNMFLIEHLRN